MGKKYPANKIKYTNNDYLLAADELANKYEMSGLTVRKLAAWIRLESGSGIYGNNPGNIRCSAGDDYYIHPFAVDEYINGKRVVAKDANDPLRKFRYFKTLSLGIEGMLKWLINNHPSALADLMDDEKSAYSFAYTLGSKDKRGYHYYTANKVKYATGVEDCFKLFVNI